MGTGTYTASFSNPIKDSDETVYNPVSPAEIQLFWNGPSTTGVTEWELYLDWVNDSLTGFISVPAAGPGGFAWNCKFTR